MLLVVSSDMTLLVRVVGVFVYISVWVVPHSRWVLMSCLEQNFGAAKVLVYSDMTVFVGVMVVFVYVFV